MTNGEDTEWQRLDKWLWCARFLKTRAACARWAAEGGIRINRQPTDKPHARLRPGDVLTLPFGTPERTAIRVIRVTTLAARRGPATEARTLYEDLPEAAPQQPTPPDACPGGESAAYAPT